MQSQNNMTQPPVAERIPYEIKTPDSDTRTDYYYWMRFREDPKVIEYLNAENAYMNQIMQHTEAVQQTLFHEMKNRVKSDESSYPYKKGNYYFYTRYEAGGEYAIYCRKKESLNSKEEIIVNGDSLGKGKPFLNFWVKSNHDNTIAAVPMDTQGRNFFTIRFKDLSNGEWLKDEIPMTRNNVVWTLDNKALIYTIPHPETLRIYQVKKHVLGTDVSKDVLLYEEPDETLDCALYISRSEKYIFIDASRTDANEIRFTSAENPGDFRLFQQLTPDMFYSVDHVDGDKFLIHTNYKAKNYRLCEAQIRNTMKEKWVDIISHRSDVFLNEVLFFKNFMVAEESINGLTQFRIIKPEDTMRIQFAEPGYYISLGTNEEFDVDFVRYNYASLITPFSVYDYDLNTRQSILRKSKEVPTYDKTKYVSERIMVEARDGKLVPMTIAYRKDKFKKDGTMPGFIYGYGSYGYSNEDYFDSNIISLLDRGFVYANTHIRGGQDMGGQWYEDGKMLHKKNTFYDFIDCSAWLIDNKYVAKNGLFANGGSAGGLLMGVVVNMRPDLYKGVIADVPFVDVLSTMEDETIPLTTFEWLEWGNPKIKEQYDYMKSYSPYDNVEAKAYPNLLVTTGLYDSQVQYWEPAKWVAKLRYTKTDKNNLLLRTNMSAGHGGKYGRYESMHEIAFMYAFILDVWNSGK
ncbi:MAG: S9 family peptidase [Chitinophagales bacterium]